MQSRPLTIYTEFFDDEQSIKRDTQLNGQHNRIYFTKQTATFQLENQLKTLLLKKLFSSWNNIKYHQPAERKSIYDNIREEVVNIKSVEERLKMNTLSIKQMNKNIFSIHSSPKKKYKSLSPTCSNSSMHESRALVLNQIVEKLKFRHRKIQKDGEDNNLHRRLNKLEKMLGNIKLQHEKTQNGKHKIKKLLTRQDLDQTQNINTNKCLQEIYKLKQQLKQIKNAQNNLWTEKYHYQLQRERNIHRFKNMQNLKKNQSYITSSIPSMANVNIDPRTEQNTRRVQVTQSSNSDHNLTYRYKKDINQFKPTFSKVSNSSSHRDHNSYKQCIVKPMIVKNVPCFFEVHPKENIKRSVTFISNHPNITHISKQIKNSTVRRNSNQLKIVYNNPNIKFNRGFPLSNIHPSQNRAQTSFQYSNQTNKIEHKNSKNKLWIA